MRPIRLILALALLPAAAWAAPVPDAPPGLQKEIRLAQVPPEMQLPALEVDKLRAEDKERRAAGKPPRYAVEVETTPVTPDADGAWETLADGRRVWRYKIHARQATSVEPAFTTFHLPEGAALYVHGNDGKRVRGPYTHEDNESHGQLWVPIVEGPRATVELVLQPGVNRESVALEMTRVLQGYDAFWKEEAATKDTKSCNVDVVCPQAEGWEDPIASVALITIGGAACTGQMINDTAYSGRPLFLTANHCGLRESNAPSLQVYWNYENSTCREISDTPKPETPPGDDDKFEDAQSGATFLSRFVASDFTLVELDDMPNPEWDVFWTGWDRRDQTYDKGIGIHHPKGEEKRISFERDELEIIDGSTLIGPSLPGLNSDNVRPRSHFKVRDWDLGVTEGGSSGSGLWNGRQRLVGQLHGGGRHQCDNNDFDWYGRFWMSWEGGGTAATSLDPWLDPVGSGDKFNDGRDGDCAQPNVTIQDSAAAPRAGELFTLSAVGGSSAVDFHWDIDGDGVADARGRTVDVRFSGAGPREVELIASNRDKQCGTTVSKTVTVKAADVGLASVGKPRETEGDGDDVMEPGERWRLPVSLNNDGNARARQVRAVFARSGILAGDSTDASDSFGYTMAGSRESDKCNYRFVNIAGQNNRVDFDAVDPSFPANDDGGSDGIATDNFQFYNQSVSSIVMSSNGYLAPSAARNGGDFSNDCPLPAAPNLDAGGSTGQARMAAYHDDLVTNLAWYLRQDPCERPGDVAGGNGACRIFQWSNVEVLDPSTYNSSNVSPFDLDEFKFQAILYEGTGEVVYQFDKNVPTRDSTPTVGIQDNTSSSGLTWGCSTHEPVTEVAPIRPEPATAVCFFHPKAPAPGPDPAALSLDNPALEYDDIPAGGFQTSQLEFRIEPDAECGDQFGIRLHGVQYQGGFSPGPGNIFTATVGGEDAVCEANVKAAAPKAEIDFRPGMYFNGDRNGHGADIHRSGDNVSILWFTYGEDRQATWYLGVGEYEDNQVVADLLRFTEETRNSGTDVGEFIVTFTDETHALFNWTLDGEAGGEPFAFFQFDTGEPPKQRTGLWFPPSQNGWGMSFNTQGDTEVTTTYFYDANGQPAWAQGSKRDPGDDTFQLDQFKGPCPGCDWAPPEVQPVGTLSRQFDGPSDGSVTTDITLEPPRDGTWNRDSVDITILSDPLD